MSRLSLALVLVCAAWLAGCTQVAGNINPPTVQQFTTVTADGWALSIQRFKPANLDASRLPVVLCHGLSYNGQFWDLAPEVSLARYLAESGYDVWVPSLRGAGWSTKPPLSRLRQLFRGDLYTAGGVFTSGGRGALKINWTVDDHVQSDLPAILEFVLAQTHQPSVHWIGHSMGGMIMVAHLSANPQDKRIASFVALAVPVVVSRPLSKPMQMLAEARGAVEVSNVLLSTNLPALFGQIAGGKLAGPIDVLFYNPANVNDDVLRRLASWGTDDIAPGQLGQLIDMVACGRFRSTDAKTDYTANIEQMQPPALFMVGAVDNLATVDSVKTLFNRWGGTEKRFELFGRVNGQGSDYGHDDLVIGKNARLEVFPIIRQWLDRRSGRKLDALGL